jgi:hypothetical protein
LTGNVGAGQVVPEIPVAHVSNPDCADGPDLYLLQPLLDPQTARVIENKFVLREHVEVWVTYRR